MSLINSLHSFFLKISRPATIAAITVITLPFFWLINLQGVSGIPKLANGFTLVKWTFAAISIVLLLVATLGLLIRNLRRPASD